MKTLKFLLIFSLIPVFLLAQVKEPEEKEEFPFIEEVPFLKVDSCDQLEYNERKACADQFVMDFINQNLHYPMKDSGIQGRVYIRFVIDERGNMRDYEVLRNSTDHPIFAEEAINVLKLLDEKHQWHPGKQYNRAVKVRFVIPIKFSLR